MLFCFSFFLLAATFPKAEPVAPLLIFVRFLSPVIFLCCSCCCCCCTWRTFCTRQMLFQCPGLGHFFAPRTVSISIGGLYWNKSPEMRLNDFWFVQIFYWLLFCLLFSSVRPSLSLLFCVCATSPSGSPAIFLSRVYFGSTVFFPRYMYIYFCCAISHFAR